MSAEEASAAERRRAAALAIITSALLITLKLALAVVTGSVAILAEAAHSAANLLASLVAALGARSGSSTAGAFEGSLVIAAAAVIGYAAVRGLGDHVDVIGGGIVGLVASSVAAALAARYVGEVARTSESRALQADAAQLRTTSVTSAAVAGTLGIIALTGLDGLDALAALGIAVVIARSGLDLIRAVRPGNEGLDAVEIAAVARILAAGPSEVIGYRRLRARTAGGVRRIDVDVTVRRDATPVEIAHVRSALEWALEDGLPNARVVVHIVRPSSPRRPSRSRRVP
jgi:divalent metal cation (Fe/Co/Zn/Cd) transporter